MNLSNFENHINEVILKRGRDYFENGNIQGIKEKENNQHITYKRRPAFLDELGKVK